MKSLRRFSRFLSAAVIAGAFFAAAPLQAAASKPALFHKGMDCPVMPGEKVKEKFYADYKGQRIYLCCRSCVRSFKRNPEKYLARMAAAQHS
ncbi:MAG TPA: hypothetical protein VL688_00645 [Verrucomicrobiae bacterium]|nr:hypothetical protein [Verrucomicrobiae bacterium]